MLREARNVEDVADRLGNAGEHEAAAAAGEIAVQGEERPDAGGGDEDQSGAVEHYTAGGAGGEIEQTGLCAGGFADGEGAIEGDDEVRSTRRGSDFDLLEGM